MSLPVFFPPAEISLALPEGQRTTLAALCHSAGIDCRVTGLSASRPLLVAQASAMRAVRGPGPLSEVWLGIPAGKPARRSLVALGLLAFGVFDYGARECLRGLDVAKASAGPGRPRTGRAMSAAEKQRRYRERLASSNSGWMANWGSRGVKKEI